MSVTEDQAVIEAVNRATGAGLAPAGRAEHGTLGGAIFAESADGRKAVITRYLGPLDEARRTAAVVDHARRHGLPVPRHLHVLPIGAEVVIVQERLPGSPPTVITATLMDRIIELNDRFAGLLADRPDGPIAWCTSCTGRFPSRRPRSWPGISTSPRSGSSRLPTDPGIRAPSGART